MNPNARRGKVAGIVFLAECVPGARQDALGGGCVEMGSALF